MFNNTRRYGWGRVYSVRDMNHADFSELPKEQQQINFSELQSSSWEALLSIYSFKFILDFSENLQFFFVRDAACCRNNHGIVWRSCSNKLPRWWQAPREPAQVLVEADDACGRRGGLL